MSVTEEGELNQRVIAVDTGDQDALREARDTLKGLAQKVELESPIPNGQTSAGMQAELKRQTEVVCKDQEGKYYGVQTLIGSCTRDGSDEWYHVRDGFVIREYGHSDPRQSAQAVRTTLLKPGVISVSPQADNPEIQLLDVIQTLQVGLTEPEVFKERHVLPNEARIKERSIRVDKHGRRVS